VSHQGFAGKTDSTEEWYGTDYNFKNVAPETMIRWERCLSIASVSAATPHGDGSGSAGTDGSDDAELLTALHLPRPNEFIATDFTLKTADTKSSRSSTGEEA
jgi:secreted Zn-dependent insulinase-like peptidase